MPARHRRERVQAGQQREAEAQRDRDDPRTGGREQVRGDDRERADHDQGERAERFGEVLVQLPHDAPLCSSGRDALSLAKRSAVADAGSGALAGVEIREPDLDERAHGVLEPGLARGLERLLVALAHLRPGRRPA